MEALRTVYEHRSISLVQYVPANLNDEVGSDANDVLVERGVMELAQRKSVPNGRFTERIGVRDDVRCVEESLVSKATQRAALLIRTEHPRAKAALVEPLSVCPSSVF